MIRTLTLLTLFAVFATSDLAQAAIMVDGNLSDWGIATIADNNGSNFGVTNNPIHPGTQGTRILGSGSLLKFHIEDQDDNAGDSGYLGPNHGGQNYDGEFIGAILDKTQFSVVLVTGQRPDNGFNRFGMGDLRIETSIGTFGVELGGGIGNSSTTQGAITEGALGSTFRLNSNGFTKGVLLSDGTEAGDISGNPPLLHSAAQTAGSLWLNPQWITDPIPPPGPTQLQFVGGTLLGQVDFYFSRDSQTAQHSIVELSFDALQMLGMGVTINSIHWRPSCGNDELNIDQFGMTVVPEPATAAIWSVLCVGMVFYARRNRPAVA